MGTLLFRRFDVIKGLSQGEAFSSYLVNDGLRRSAGTQVLKVYKKRVFAGGPSVLADILSWHRGLSHPHLVKLEEFGLTPTKDLFVLRNHLPQAFVPEEATETQLTELLAAVSFLHGVGKAHGGIKPSNVFIGDERVQLADPGIPLLMQNSENDVGFSAPEVLSGGRPTFESDYYSIGALMYRMYSGRTPFDDPLLENLRTKQLFTTPMPLRESCGISEVVSGIVSNLLRRNPAKRRPAFDALLGEFKVRRTMATAPPFVGRATLMESFKAKLFNKTPTLRVILLTGEPGSGKSKMIDEIRYRAGLLDTDVLVGSCSPKGSLFRAISTALRSPLLRQVYHNDSSLEQELGTLGDSLIPIVANESFLPEDLENTSAERVASDFVGLTRILSHRKQLILCLENIEAADKGTLGFVEQLCYRASEVPIKLILTSRGSPKANDCITLIEQWIGPAHLIRQELPPLNDSEASELIHFVEGERVKHLSRLKMAGGNPLCLLECPQHDGEFQYPPAVFNLSEYLLKNVSKQAFHVLQGLATAGSRTQSALIKDVLNMDAGTLETSMAELKRAHILHDSGGCVEFRLGPMRSSIEASLSKSETRMLHKNWFRVLRMKGFGGAELAPHAFCAGLWSDASHHYTGLARRAILQGEFKRALECYGKVSKCKDHLGEELNPTDRINVANCLARTGKKELAITRYRALLKNPQVRADKTALASVMIGFAQLDPSSVIPKLAVLQEAIASNSQDSTQMAELYSRLTTTFVMKGDLLSARASIEKATASIVRPANADAELCVKAAEGFLLMNLGQFKEALTVFSSVSTRNLSMYAAVLTNSAICLEHLGEIQAAFGVQTRAYRIAQRSGHVLGEASCLANLGSFSVMLGRLTKANQYFVAAEQSFVRSRKSRSLESQIHSIQGEKACLHTALGNYEAALVSLRKAMANKNLSEGERCRTTLLLIDLYVLLGRNDLQHLTDMISSSPLKETALFEIQWGILEARRFSDHTTAKNLLTHILDQARQRSMLYEKCMIEIELAGRSLRADEPEEARGYLDEALRIAKKNGYRPLAARAMMLRGLVGRHPKEKEHWLIRGYKLAAEIGIPELVAESAYHIGAMLLASGHMATAREYLLKSTATTSQILEHVPQRYRAKYMTKPWRRDARQLLQVCIDKLDLALPPSAETRTGRNDRLFRSLYHTNVAATAAQSVDAFTSALLRALGEIQGRSAVVLLKHADRTSWHPVGVELTDEIKKRISAIAAKAQEKTYLDYQDRTLTKGTVGWIPFRAQPLSGGIYVSCGKGESSLGENEIEFLTILGTLASSAFDRISSRRAIATRAPVRSDSYGLIGSSRAMQEVHSHIEIAAGNLATVLIEGETGTGKELVARAIHLAGARAGNPFIAVDCGAIPESLIESELFGAVRGAYTGAVADRRGLFESAHRGTLFLDEISNTSASTQAKLLRVLQEREVRRIGDNKARPIDVRLIAAANRNLATLVDDGRFRQDLLYRINVLHIVLPPLRNRRDDIPLLAEHFLDGLNSRHNGRKRFANGAFDPLNHYNFPGNVRELQNAVERAYFHAPGNVIVAIPIERPSPQVAVTDDVQSWFKDLTEGRKNFWTAVRDRYKRRDISREHVVALMDVGLRRTQGSYKDLAELFRLGSKGYRPLMDFLRRSDCLLDFRQYRKPPEPIGQ